MNKEWPLFLEQFESNSQNHAISEKIFLLDDTGKIKQKISYEEIKVHSQQISIFLKNADLARQRIILLFPAGIEFIIAMISCMYAKTIFVPLNVPTTKNCNRLNHVVDDCSPKGVLTDRNTLKLIQGLFNEECLFEWTKTVDFGDIVYVPIKSSIIDEQSFYILNSSTDVSFIQYTSGSTFLPKGVMVTNSNLAYNINYIIQSFELKQNDVSLTWLPNYHDMGLIDGILVPLYLSCSSYILSPIGFLKNPLVWLKSISQYKITHSGGPNFSYDMCVKAAKKALSIDFDLSCWKSAYNGAEPIIKESIDNFSGYFKKHGFSMHCFYPCYGLAETTLMVTGCDVKREPVFKYVDTHLLKSDKIQSIEHDNSKGQYLVSSGIQRLETRVLIVDPESNEEIPINQIGEVWVGGPTVALGYWNKEVETSNYFKCYTANTKQGPFLRTGDMGFLDENNELFITGRLKDIIIINGENYYPQDIEYTAERIINSTRPHICAAFCIEAKQDKSSILYLLIHVKKNFYDAISMQDLCSKIANDVYNEYHIAIHFIALTTNAIPKTTSGKVQRQNCRKLYLEGAFNCFYVWENKMLEEANNENSKLLIQIENHLVFWLANKFDVGIDKIDKNADFSVFYMDSIKIAEMFTGIEKKFNLSIPLDVIYSYPSITKLAMYICDEICSSSTAAIEPEVLEESKKLNTYCIPDFDY